MTSFVYRIYDIRDMLLYVGLTDNMVERIGNHRSQQPWRSEINHYTFRKFGSRREAARVEKKAIRLLRPSKNNPKNPPTPWPLKPHLWDRPKENCNHDWALSLTRGVVVCRKCGERTVGELKCKRGPEVAWLVGDRFRCGRKRGAITGVNQTKKRVCVRYDDGGETLHHFYEIKKEDS